MDNGFDERNNEFGENENTENNSGGENVSGNSFENQYSNANGNEETSYNGENSEPVKDAEPADDSFVFDEDIIDGTVDEEPFEPESYESDCGCGHHRYSGRTFFRHRLRTGHKK